MIITDKDELEHVLRGYGEEIQGPLASSMVAAKDFSSGYVHFYRSSLHQTRKIWEGDLEDLFKMDKRDDTHYRSLPTSQKFIYNLGTGTAMVTGGALVSIFNMFLTTPLYFRTRDKKEQEKGKK